MNFLFAHSLSYLIVLLDPLIRLKWLLLHSELGSNFNEGILDIHQNSGFELHYPMFLCHTQRTLVGVFYLSADIDTIGVFYNSSQRSGIDFCKSSRQNGAKVTG